MESWNELNPTEAKKEVNFGHVVCARYKINQLTLHNLNNRLQKAISKSWYTFFDMLMQHMAGGAIVRQECVTLAVSWEKNANSKYRILINL